MSGNRTSYELEIRRWNDVSSFPSFFLYFIPAEWYEMTFPELIEDWYALHDDIDHPSMQSPINPRKFHFYFQRNKIRFLKTKHLYGARHENASDRCTHSSCFEKNDKKDRDRHDQSAFLQFRTGGIYNRMHRFSDLVSPSFTFACSWTCNSVPKHVLKSDMSPTELYWDLSSAHYLH